MVTEGNEVSLRVTHVESELAFTFDRVSSGCQLLAPGRPVGCGDPECYAMPAQRGLVPSGGCLCRALEREKCATREAKPHRTRRSQRVRPATFNRKAEHCGVEALGKGQIPDEQRQMMNWQRHVRAS